MYSLLFLKTTTSMSKGRQPRWWQEEGIRRVLSGFFLLSQS